MLLLDNFTLVTTDALQPFGNYLTARADSGTTNRLQAIFLRVGLGRVAQGAGPR